MSSLPLSFLDILHLSPLVLISLELFQRHLRIKNVNALELSGGLSSRLPFKAMEVVRCVKTGIWFWIGTLGPLRLLIYVLDRGFMAATSSSGSVMLS
jgi:hypothetical protein|tara:strand:+ start:3729 stop:4019 length:291 start_codon:yes stop_codon:yes gene_type:complete